MADSVSIEVEPVNLRSVLTALKAVDPKLAANLRRELRRSGVEILAAQRAALAKRPPKVAGSTKELRLIRPRNGRKPYFAFRTTHKAGETRTGGASHLRSAIASGLRVRTSSSARRPGVELRTGGPRIGGANMARVYESRQFRHPVYGQPGQWVPQYGQPYFYNPITDALRNRMETRINDAIRDALAGIGDPQ